MFRRPDQKRRRLPIRGPLPSLPLDRSTNQELCHQFFEWMICQRYSPHTMWCYKRVVNDFLAYWGDRKLSAVTHLEVRKFLIEKSRYDLSADIIHRYIWPLRCFFDFLQLGMPSR